MFFASLQRVFRSGWQGFSRDGGMVAANIFILTLAVSVFTALLIFGYSSDFVISEIQRKVDISVYFKYEIPEEEILSIKDSLNQVPEVKEVKYVSKDLAMEDFINRHQDDPVLMQSLEEVGVNPFLASLSIKSNQANQYAAIASFFEGTTFENKIEKINYYEREPVIERIFSLTSSIQKIGIGFSLLLAVIAVLVVLNTIRLAIYNFREEIKIQRLVGASNWFIRGPFLIQGIISGFFAALISLVFFTLLTWGFNSTIDKMFSGLNLFSLFLAKFWLIFALQMVSGIVLGIISSLIAIRRHLNV